MTSLPNQIFALLHGEPGPQLSVVHRRSLGHWHVAFVSMRRIETFLSEDEVDVWACSLKRDVIHTNPIDDGRIGFEKASFRWHTVNQSVGNADNSSTVVFGLHDLDIEFPVGKLSLVTGLTGSGKSSLLAALLGEMDRVSGKIHFSKHNHAVAYAGQFPYLEVNHHPSPES
jgi:ABC-type multidrug transport system fused ATPase/permease subunit